MVSPPALLANEVDAAQALQRLRELKEAFERSISRADAAAGGVGGGIGKEL